MGFLKLLLNLSLYIILATNIVFCAYNDLKIIRLPNNTVPLFYNISLTLNLEEDNFTFHGESNIKIEIRYASLNNISLHSKELEINEMATTLINNNSTVYKPIEHSYNNEMDILTLNFENALSPGFYILNMKFAGIIPKNSLYKGGFMRIPYTNGGEINIMVATFSEPSGARQIFPCWDEPALKAIFNISVMHHVKYLALSNMPLVRREFFEYDMTCTYFNTSPIMSTYLVAIIVIPMIDFHSLSNEKETVNVWCRSSLLRSEVTFMYNIIEKVTPFLIQYTNNSEKVPKMDHFIAPNYPVVGMEHWGLVIYNESSVAYDINEHPTYRRADVAIIITHEIAHQWFGNLVTPSWWSYHWLKEGLASFLHTYIIDKIFNDWRAVDSFVIEILHLGLLIDVGILGPVTLELDSAFNRINLFSFVVYEKASVIFRMLQNTITDEVFRKGLVIYLATHEYSPTTPDDLWSAMQTALDESDVPHEQYKIKEVMDTWMNQNSYPEVNVIKNYTTGEVTISQKCVYEHEINNKWWIPITFATQSNPNFSNTVPRYWLRPDENVTFITDPSDWIIVNIQQTGYYRVSYDIKNWEKISNYLNSEKYTNIHVLNRAQIIDDLFSFMDGRISGFVFVNLIRYLQREVDYVAWYPLLFRVIPILKEFFFLPEATYVKITIMALLSNLLRNIGYLENDDDDHITKLTRLEAIKWACTTDDKFCKNTALVKLNQHLADPELYKMLPGHDNMYCFGLMAANRTTWNKMLELYQKTDPEKEKFKKMLMKSLSCAENSDIIINYLNITAFNTSLFHEKEHSLIFKFILDKHLNNDLILDYILSNFEIIKPKLFTTTVIIKHILRNLFYDEQIDKIFRDWRTMDSFVVKNLQFCLRRDKGGLGPVTMELNSISDRPDLSIVFYQKAPVILRMLQNTITDEIFRKGLIIYLATHEYSSTTPDDLWSAMQTALDGSDVPHEHYKIKEVMDTWMNQKSYPEVNVTKNYTTGEIIISQKCVYGQEINDKWWIPITFATQSNPDFSNTVPRYWLRPNQNVTFITDPNDWIIVNIQQTGYYRVSYDIKNWEKISNYLNSEEYTNIHVLNRAQIIDDLFSFMDGRISGFVFVNFIRYLQREVDYVAWYQLLFRFIPILKEFFFLPEATYVKNICAYNILNISSIFEHSAKILLSFRHIGNITIMTLLSDLLRNIGYLENIDDDHITKQIRIKAIKWACTFNDQFCKNTIFIKLNQHLADPELYKVLPGHNFMYCVGLMATNKTTWDKMLELYQKTDLEMGELKETLLNSLSCAENSDIIINYLNITTFNTSLFHEKERSLIFKSILNKHLNNDLILDYILSNFEIIKPK
ncbi:Aminopeptidase N [Trachymyrmex zeteki]|uniref:Aminopeptidase N n=1 Tax=Mycetomoellerius zeteki TaxID=64791 RepID=A0A151XCE0_9HYME|nr:Aminopeptidase N [Trachymyrmex zeteki]